MRGPPLPTCPVMLWPSPALVTGRSSLESMSPFLAVACRSKARTPGHGQLDLAIAVVNLQLAHGRDRAHRDVAISILDPQVAGNAGALDVLGAGRDSRRAGGVVQLQVTAVDRESSGKGDHFDVGPAGMKMDRLGNVGQVGVPEEIAVQRHPALHLGDGNVVQPALKRQVAGDGMGAEVAFAHAHMKSAGDVIGFDVSAVRIHVGRAGKTLEGDVPMPGRHRGHRAVGDLDGQIGVAIAPIRRAQGHVAAVDHQLGASASRLRRADRSLAA